MPHDLEHVASLEWLQRTTKVVPSAPFGKRTTGLGADVAARRSPLAHASSGIKILGVYCESDYLKSFGRPIKRTASKRSRAQDEELHGVDASGTCTPPADSLTAHAVASQGQADVSSHEGTASGQLDTSTAASPFAADAKSSKQEETNDDVDKEKEGSKPLACDGSRVYLRVVVDKSLEFALPLDVVRERHPQLLIDYLLSTAVYY